MDDAALVRAARQGDRVALATLLERHLPRVRAACRGVLADEELAADAAQETLLAAMLALDTIRDLERFGPWIDGVARRQALRIARRRGTRVGMPPPACAPGADEEAVRNDEARRLRAAVTALPGGQRDAVALVHFAQLDTGEAALRLGTSAGAIRVRLHKARATLRADLEEAAPMVTMAIDDVRPVPDDEHVLILREPDGERHLTIWVGAAEARALAAAVARVEAPRPRSYELALGLLGAAGAQIEEVRVTSLRAMIFYAEVVLDSGRGVDARPSDALTLAAITGAPIRVEEAVLESAQGAPEEAAALAAPAGLAALADEVRGELAEIARRQAP